MCIAYCVLRNNSRGGHCNVIVVFTQIKTVQRWVFVTPCYNTGRNETGELRDSEHFPALKRNPRAGEPLHQDFKGLV